VEEELASVLRSRSNPLAAIEDSIIFSGLNSIIRNGENDESIKAK